jgi:hypothetical protein
MPFLREKIESPPKSGVMPVLELGMQPCAFCCVLRLKLPSIMNPEDYNTNKFHTNV